MDPNTSHSLLATEILDQFYIELHDWLQLKPPHDIFHPRHAICGTLRDWLLATSPYSTYHYRSRDEICKAARYEFNLWLPEQKECSTLPFNESLMQYRKEAGNCSVYKNPARLAWIEHRYEQAMIRKYNNRNNDERNHD